MTMIRKTKLALALVGMGILASTSMALATSSPKIMKVTLVNNSPVNLTIKQFNKPSNSCVRWIPTPLKTYVLKKNGGKVEENMDISGCFEPNVFESDFYISNTLSFVYLMCSYDDGGCEIYGYNFPVTPVNTNTSIHFSGNYYPSSGSFKGTFN